MGLVAALALLRRRIPRSRGILMRRAALGSLLRVGAREAALLVRVLRDERFRSAFRHVRLLRDVASTTIFCARADLRAWAFLVPGTRLGSDEKESERLGSGGAGAFLFSASARLRGPGRVPQPAKWVERELCRGIAG
jgi:hypothetical protein